MLNTLFNAGMKKAAAFAARKYARYPAQQTAVLLVSTQNAFLDDALTAQLAKLVAGARERNISIIHAPLAQAKPMRPTPAQIELCEALADDAAAQVPAALVQAPDIMLAAQARLSAFADGALDGYLQQQGIEHIVIAGPLAALTVDATLRDAAQRDLHVTAINDVCTAKSPEAFKATVQVTWPRFAHHVLSTNAWFKLAR